MSHHKPGPSPRLFTLAILCILALTGPGFANDFKLNNLDLDYGWIKIKAPVLDVRGSALNEAELRALLDPKSPETSAARLARLTVQGMAAQELTVTAEILGQTATYRYEAVAVSGIEKGRIASASSARGNGQYSDPKGNSTTVDWTATRIDGFNLAALNEALTTTRAPGSQPRFLTIIERHSVDSSVQTQGTGFKVSSGPSEARGLALSPGTTSLQARMSGMLGWIAASIEAEASGKKTPEPDLVALADYFSVLDDMRLGSSETRDIQLTMGADSKIGLTSGFSVRIARVSLVDNGVSEASGMRMEGVSGESGQTKFALGQFAATGFSAAPAFAALRSDLASGRLGKGRPADSAEQMLRYIPKLGSVKMADLRIETPNETSRQAAKEFSPLTALGIRLMEITVRAQENGIPSDLRLAMEGLQAPVSKSDPNHALLAQMGYSAIDTSARIDMTWIRDRSEIAVREIGLDGVDMTGVKISGTIGNATKDLFSGDAGLAQVAAFGATLKALDLKLENLGLMDRYLAMEARKAKKTPDALRREWATMATLILPAILGDSDAAKAITGAVSRFIASPKSLTVNARAQNPAGVGLADVIAAGDPKAVLGKIDVKASAE